MTTPAVRRTVAPGHAAAQRPASRAPGQPHRWLMEARALPAATAASPISEGSVRMVPPTPITYTRSLIPELVASLGPCTATNSRKGQR